MDTTHAENTSSSVSSGSDNPFSSWHEPATSCTVPGPACGSIMRVSVKSRCTVGNAQSQLSCFIRWSEYAEPGSDAGKDSSLKIEVPCKQCGGTFVKYAYSRTSRCEHCRNP